MRKIESLDRTLIDFLSFLLVYTCFYGFSAMLVQGFVGVAAGFHWYLVIIASVLLYTYLYYDSRAIVKILPFVKGGNGLDRALSLILLLPVLLPILSPAEFPTTEHKYWIGSYILVACLLSVRHVGIYAHDIMSGVAKYVFAGMATFIVLLYLLMPHQHLPFVLPRNAIYLIIVLTTTVLLLHLLRLDERSESFVRREFLLLVSIFVAVCLLYFSGAIAAVEYVLNSILEGLGNILSAFVRLFDFGSGEVTENIRETLPTVSVATESMTYSTQFLSAEVLTTTEEATVELKPFDFRLIYIPAILIALWLAYWITKKKIRKGSSDLFVEERESISEEKGGQRRRRRSIFARKTPSERVRYSYKRFMKLLESPKDTTTNLEMYVHRIGDEGKKEARAKKLTEIYQRTRYIDSYDLSEAEAREAEECARTLEKQNTSHERMTLR